MKKFLITVNGQSYEVEVEEVGAQNDTAPVAKPQAAATPAPAPKAAAPAPRPAAAAPKPQAPSAGGAGAIKAPIPGTVLDIKVQQGAKVNAGDILLILEAMKMENEILAPKAGTVSAIYVSKGQSVNSGDAMILVE